jgi:hypothetical protein
MIAKSRLTLRVTSRHFRITAVVSERFRSGPIVLQNSFLRCVQIFPGALVRSLENYVGGHMNSLISNRPPL